MGWKHRAVVRAAETVVTNRAHQLCYEHALDGARPLEKHGRHRFAERAGAALGLAYAMHDRAERWRDVRAQLKEAHAFSILAGETHPLDTDHDPVLRELHPE